MVPCKKSLDKLKSNTYYILAHGFFHSNDTLKELLLGAPLLAPVIKTTVLFEAVMLNC